MEASHNDTRPTDRPLYDVSSLSAPSTCGTSTSTVHQRPQQQDNSLPIAGQETQGVQQGPQQQANSLPIPGKETQGVATFFTTLGMGNFVNSFEGRLQVGQTPSDISSVFDPISSHIPVKIKETIWK